MGAIDSLKKKHSCTSEQIFDLSRQPDDNCPFIDSLIKDINIDHNYLKRVIDDLEIEKSEKGDLYDYSDIDNIVDGLENLRSRIEELREWGNQWKTLAKEMFDRLPDDIRNEFQNIE